MLTTKLSANYFCHKESTFKLRGLLLGCEIEVSPGLSNFLLWARRSHAFTTAYIMNSALFTYSLFTEYYYYIMATASSFIIPLSGIASTAFSRKYQPVPNLISFTCYDVRLFHLQSGYLIKMVHLEVVSFTTFIEPYCGNSDKSVKPFEFPFILKSS